MLTDCCLDSCVAFSSMLQVEGVQQLSIKTLNQSWVMQTEDRMLVFVFMVKTISKGF